MSESGRKASAGVDRGLELVARGAVALGGEPLASRGLVFLVGFVGLGMGREEGQSADAAGEDRGENESEA